MKTEQRTRLPRNRGSLRRKGLVLSIHLEDMGPVWTPEMESWPTGETEDGDFSD